MELSIGKRGGITAYISEHYSTVLEIQDAVSNGLLTQGIFPTLESLPSFYLLYNGKLLEDNEVDKVSSLENSIVSVVPRLLGGKGGFGSMLRSIGAQIEKTTNRDACRDLSGRRLRDINEEAGLKKWYARRKEREEARQEAKMQKLKRLRNFADGPALPKIDDQEFLQKRGDVEESVFAAVDEAFSKIPEITDSEIRSNSSPSRRGGDNSEKFPNPFAGMLEAGGFSTSLEKADQSKKKPQKGTVKTMFNEDSNSNADSSSDEDDEVPVKAKKAKLAT